MEYIAGFILCGAVIFFAGKKVSYYGDLIAELTGLGRAWIGLILMAFVTSLPELMVGISSVRIVENADLAVGDIMGSCAFNLGILAMMDAFVPEKKRLFGVASQNHVVAAAMGIILLAMAGFGLYLSDDIIVIPGIGLMSLLFIGIYFFSAWLLYRMDANSEKSENNNPVNNKENLSLKQVLIRFSGFALLIIGAALLLPWLTDHIADKFSLDKSFAGTILLAGATSLPEIAVSLAAIRMGAVDMAVGNLLGSNMFNILILAVDDIFYAPGPLLKHAAEVNLISCLSTILMSAVAIIGLSFGLKAKRFWLAWDSIIIFGIYIVNMVLLYQLTSE